MTWLLRTIRALARGGHTRALTRPSLVPSRSLRRGPCARRSASADQPPRGGAYPLRSLSTSAPASLGADERRVDEVLGEEPRLEFSRADDVRDNQVVGAVVTERGDPAGRVVRV